MAAESIGNLIPTKIPGYADAADIQAALRLYHYGSYTYDTTNTNVANLVNPSIAYTLNNLQTQINSLDLGISATTFNAKGDILSASSNDTPIVLSVGTNGTFLKANSSTASGLEWSTLTAGSTSTPGILQLTDSTSSTSTTTAATPNSVKSTYDLASTALSTAQSAGNNAIPISAFDNKGDILVATANDTYTKLAAGSEGYYLSVDSSTTTGLAWKNVSASGSSYADILLLMGA